MFLLGRVARASGLGGDLRIQLFRPRRSPRASPGRARGLGLVQLRARDGSTARDHATVRARLVSPDSAIIHLEGVSDRTAAELLEGLLVYADPARAPAALLDDADALVGAVAIDPTGAPLGLITGVEDNGAQALLVVTPDGTEREVLVPFVEAFVGAHRVQAEHATVELRPIPGLFDGGEL